MCRHKVLVCITYPYTAYSASVQLPLTTLLPSRHSVYLRFIRLSESHTISYRRVPISTPAVRVRRDRFGQLLNTSETKEPRGIDEDNQILKKDEDNQMLREDEEYRDPGAYPKYARDSDTSNQEPITTLESSQVNNYSDSEADP